MKSEKLYTNHPNLPKGMPVRAHWKLTPGLTCRSFIPPREIWPDPKHY